MACTPIAKATPPPRESNMLGPSQAQASGGLTNFSLPIACPRHSGGRGWSMLDPCEACIAFAMWESPLRPFPVPSSHAAASAVLPKSDNPGLDVQEEGASAPRSLGGPPPCDPPPSPPPMACWRHRGRGGWSLSNPCEDCLLLGMTGDL